MEQWHDWVERRLLGTAKALKDTTLRSSSRAKAYNWRFFKLLSGQGPARLQE